MVDLGDQIEMKAKREKNEIRRKKPKHTDK